MIPSNFVEFYGDQTRWFVGEVVNVTDDPLKLGRVRVRAYGVYDGVEKDEDLPWAQVVVPVTTGAHQGNGQYLGMLVGTQVFGIFLDGKNSQLPLVVGSIPKHGDQNPLADKNYPHNKVYQTERGHTKEYDDTEGNERIKEKHASGTFYEMKSNGDLHIRAKSEQKIIIEAPKGTIEVSADNVNVRGKTIRLNS